MLQVVKSLSFISVFIGLVFIYNKLSLIFHLHLVVEGGKVQGVGQSHATFAPTANLGSAIKLMKKPLTARLKRLYPTTVEPIDKHLINNIGKKIILFHFSVKVQDVLYLYSLLCQHISYILK